jgi:hypothetical protein
VPAVSPDLHIGRVWRIFSHFAGYFTENLQKVGFNGTRGSQSGGSAIFGCHRGRFTAGDRNPPWRCDTQFHSRSGYFDNLDFDIAGDDDRFACTPPDY